ncbi:MAG TPA: recombination mediator RecR [Candidatus Ratteibacteria bacterium]|nr:recombination mediator RecR [bacterium]HRR95306.1 recombination mediator RecR [Candidatus Ratteibacteria bacterium]
MKYYPEIVEKLIENFSKLPGIGPKSAERIANFLITGDNEFIDNFVENLANLKKKIKICQNCFNLSEDNICNVCKDTTRENIICVVENIKDLVIFEKASFKGKYHVLWGRISFLDKTDPDDLRIPQLIERVQKEKTKEVIIATSTTKEGEDTAAYISEILKKLNIPHSRIGYGLPVGAEIEYVDLQTIKKSIEGRRGL